MLHARELLALFYLPNKEAFFCCLLSFSYIAASCKTDTVTFTSVNSFTPDSAK